MLQSRLPGKERDAETGLDYFGARYYGSAIGRFTSPDEPLADQYPGDPQSWNLYGYVRNNPLHNIDLNGNACTHSTSPNGESIVDDVDGNGCAELNGPTNVTLSRDELNLLMLQTVGENLSSPQSWTSVARNGIEGAALFDAGLEIPGLLKSLSKGLSALLDGGISAALRDTDRLVNAAIAADPADKGGLLTKAGRALQKHGRRAGSTFPNAAGNPTALNQTAKDLVHAVLSDPARTAEFSQTGRFGKTLDIYGSNGQGLRYSADGKTFSGFIER